MESNHVVPRYQRGALPSGSRPSRRAWSRERSNLHLPGFDRPLHHQSFETMVGGSARGPRTTGDVRVGVKESPVFAAGGTLEPAAGIEPAASRLRGERPCRQDLAGRCGAGACGRRDSNPHPRRGVPGSSPLDDDHLGRDVACACVRWTPGRDFHPRDTVCSRAPRSSATGRWLPGRGSNPHLPGNSRTSCRSTTWHRDCNVCCRSN